MTTTTDVDAFRARCEAFLAEHATGLVPNAEDPTGGRAMEQSRAFQRALHDAGLAALHHPVEFGGQGLGAEHDEIYRDVAGGYPRMTDRLLSISLGMCLPMINEYGTDDQRRRYQEKAIRGDEVWCQLFSEPGAGSDVASLQMRARRDGDEWVLNGQKVWTSGAHLCRRGIVVVRTNVDVPKHHGLTMFIVDLEADGVEVRPIHQANGGTEFNEVFFTDVRVHDDERLSDVDDGWRLAIAMLMFERAHIARGHKGGVQHETADELIAEARARGRLDEPAIRDQLMQLYAFEVCQSVSALRSQAEAELGRTPGPAGSLGKLSSANVARYRRGLAMEIVGAAGIAWEGEGEWADGAVTSMLSGIAGGTNEIQRNIIGERVLGLPREPTVDRDVPFRELRVGTQAG